MSINKKGSANSGKNEPWKSIDRSAASDGDIQRVHEELVHEKESPREGFSPIPIFLVFLISGLIVFSGIYMVWRSDDFDQMGFDESRRRFAWESEETHAEPVDPLVQAGQAIYQQCAACHQQNGQGLPGAFPPLDGTRWVNGSKERLIRVVMHGLTGPIEVKGNQFNGVMPNLGLQDEDLAAVLSYVRQEWSNDAEPVSVEEVAQVRQETGSRGPWAADELLQQFPMEEAGATEEEAAPAEEPAAAEQPQ